MAKNDQTPAETPQAPEPTGPTIRIRMDERDLKTSYANGFRTSATADEVILDFGLNMPVPVRQPSQPDQADVQADREIIFHVTDRVILNYYSAKRLALTLGQLVRRHEERFGELELDESKRVRGGS